MGIWYIVLAYCLGQNNFFENRLMTTITWKVFYKPHDKLDIASRIVRLTYIYIYTIFFFLLYPPRIAFANCGHKLCKLYLIWNKLVVVVVVVFFDKLTANFSQTVTTVGTASVSSRAPQNNSSVKHKSEASSGNFKHTCFSSCFWLRSLHRWLQSKQKRDMVLQKDSQLPQKHKRQRHYR